MEQRAVLFGQECTSRWQPRAKSARPTNIAIVRVEQLYPFPKMEIEAVLRSVSPRPKSFSGCKKSRRTWARGVFFEPRLRHSGRTGRAGIPRPRGSREPGDGFYRVHQMEEQELMKRALDPTGEAQKPLAEESGEPKRV